VGLVLWLGFRRCVVPYHRRPRRFGRSAWTFGRKWKYLLDSVFAFSDRPLRVLSTLGLIAVACSVVISTMAIYARLTGQIPVQGYTITVVLIMFFGGINAFGISLLGSYVWRAFENTKQRPGYVIAVSESFGADTV
jgi:hypothetical protein